ncbi:MAG: hypothetical protein ACR2IF_08725 [Terriglobales bacterium]
MPTYLEQKQAQRADFLRMFYGLGKGAEGVRLSPTQWRGIGQHYSIPEDQLFDIVKYWVGEGVLVFKPASEALSLTHKGVVTAEKLITEAIGTSSTQPTAPPNRGVQKMRNRPFVLNILLASPSDVSDERDAVTQATHAWNASHTRATGILLNPMRWETHTYPASGDRPQAIVNRQIVEEGDILIGIFGTRLGTPTGEAESGTIEEIEKFRRAGKYVALYFSTANIPRDTDQEQLRKLETYQRERQKDTLYATFASVERLRELVTQHLPMIVYEVSEKLRPARELEAVQQEPLQPKESIRLTTELTGEYPDGPRLHVRANREITVTQLDYLDERDVRIASDTLDRFGLDIVVDLDYDKLKQVASVTQPRGMAYPIAFRLHILDSGRFVTERIPAVLQNHTKAIGGSLTMVLKLIG